MSLHLLENFLKKSAFYYLEHKNVTLRTTTFLFAYLVKWTGYSSTRQNKPFLYFYEGSK